LNLTHKPYLVDAIIGNSRMLASLSKDGRVHRLWWPHIDYPQHVDILRGGLMLDGRVTWLDDASEGWQHEAAYVDQTNILVSRAISASSPIEAEICQLVLPDSDVLVRHFTFRNKSEKAVQGTFIHYSSFHIDDSPLYNTVLFDKEQDALVHFRRGYFFMVGGSNVCTKYQSGQNAWQAASGGHLNGKGIDMAPDGALSWELVIPPGGISKLTVYITAGYSQDEAANALAQTRHLGYVRAYEQTADYWRSYLAKTTPCPVKREDIRKLYERSLLTMKLLSDEQSGAVVAAPEFDEHFSRCGGYGFCWGRDAAFIATAMDKSGLSDLASRFYDWALTAQSADGSWQQRHYHDGRLAPSWGLQIDEGASILWGMWQHYLHEPNPSFASQVWPSVRRGAHFLLSYIDPETGLPLPSVDLWEERTGEHLYSAAAVYGGLHGAAAFAELHQDAELAKQCRDAAERIRRQIIDQCWNQERESYLRGVKLQVDARTYEEALQAGKIGTVSVDSKGYQTFILAEDPVLDVSLLGLCTPFGVLPADDPRMAQTADAVEAALTVPGVGGLKRYENDPYIGGNPWILTTLWLCQYRIQQGRHDAAWPLLQWAIDHQTETGLLSEQVDRETGKPAWVVPLTWSHAMFVLAVHMLAEATADTSSAE